MFPVLFELLGFKVYSYGFLIAIGYLAALGLGRYLVKSRGLNPAPYMDLGFLAIVSGIIGARLLFLLTNFRHFAENPRDIFDLWKGGLVFYGGFLFATLTCILFLRWKKLPFLFSLDVLGACVALAHGFGRLGCLGAGCCHGSYCPYPWGIYLDSEFVDSSLRGLPLHPTQVYEAAALFLLASMLTYVIRKRTFRDGNAGLLYVMGYAVIRSVVEMFRGDATRGYVIGNWLSTSQAIALVLLLISGAVFLSRLRRQDF